MPATLITPAPPLRFPSGIIQLTFPDENELDVIAPKTETPEAQRPAKHSHLRNPIMVTAWISGLYIDVKTKFQKRRFQTAGGFEAIGHWFSWRK
jgi:hypothetical protein